MSKFLREISEEELDKKTSLGGKKNKKFCLTEEAGLAAAMIGCAYGNSSSCSEVAAFSQIISKYC